MASERFIKIFDTADNNEQLYPKVTPEIRGLLKSLRAYYDRNMEVWLLNPEDISETDFNNLSWVCEKIFLNPKTRCKLGIEIWSNENGKLTLIRSVLDEIKAKINPKKQTDEKKEQEDKEMKAHLNEILEKEKEHNDLLEKAKKLRIEVMGKSDQVIKSEIDKIQLDLKLKAKIKH